MSRSFFENRRLRLVARLAVVVAALNLGPPIFVAGAGPDADVPGMEYQVSSGQPCSERETFVFGRDSSGGLLACHWIQPYDGYFWDGPLSGSLNGTRTIGALCANLSRGVAYAQSPEGYPLGCNDGKWSRI